MDDKFQQAERDYYALRGKLDAGRITRAEFEAALKAQMTQDEQGRYWTLGVDTGKWYVHDGKDWAQADPPGASRVSSAPRATARKSNRLLIITALGCLAIVCLALAGGGAYVFFNTNPPRPTLAIFVPTSGVIIVQPTSDVIVAPTREPIVIAVPVSTSEPTTTPIPPTDTPIPTIAPSATPLVRPGVYVVSIRVEPPEPKRRQDIDFYPTILNSTDSPKSFRMTVYLFRPNQNNSMGESAGNNITVPVGAFEFRASGWKLGAGGCEDFVARVGYLDENRRQVYFTRPDGRIAERLITVCP